MKVVIKSYVDVTDITEDDALVSAQDKIEAIDAEASQDEDVITKLYYIAPVLGRIMIVISEDDRIILDESSTILLNVSLADYSLEKLPSQIVEYRELLVKKSNTLTMDNLINVAQSVVDDLTQEVLPHKLAIVKMVNINTGEEIISLPSEFSLDFNSPSEVRSSGNPSLGRILMNNTPIDFEIVNKVLVPDDDKDHSGYGWGHALNSNLYIIGSMYDDDVNTNAGMVYIYKRSDNSYIELYPEDTSDAQYFGQQIQLTETKLAISSYGINTVYVYDIDENGVTSNMVTIHRSGDDYTSKFGENIHLSDKFIMLSDAYYTVDDVKISAVYVYDLDGSNERRLTMSNSQANSGFGTSSHGLRFDENYLYVGAYNMKYDSAIYRYDLDGTNELIIMNPVTDDSYPYFSYSFTVKNGIIFAGMYGLDIGDNSDVGKIAKMDIEGNLIKFIDNPIGEEYDGFGNQVEVSDLALYVYSSTNMDKVLIFDIEGNLTKTIDNPENFDNDYFGQVMMMDNEKLFVLDKTYGVLIYG